MLDNIFTSIILVNNATHTYKSKSKEANEE